MSGCPLESNGFPTYLLRNLHFPNEGRIRNISIKRSKMTSDVQKHFRTDFYLSTLTLILFIIYPQEIKSTSHKTNTTPIEEIPMP